MNVIGIIGGSGFADPKLIMKNPEKIEVKSPFGDKRVYRGKAFGTEVAFISRHGDDRKVPPHLLNHRANIWALKDQGCNIVVSTSAVGSISKQYPIGELALPDQYIDQSWRAITFFEGGESGLEHVDMTEPFSADLRKLLRKQGENAGVSIHINGTYICNAGPQFETAAEIQYCHKMNGHLVGMTVAPEAKLFRELRIHYQPVCLPVNWGAGMTRDTITHSNTLEMVNKMSQEVLALMEAVLPHLGNASFPKL